MSRLIRTANKRYTRKLGLTTDFATFSIKKWLSCGKDFSFMLSAFCGTFFHLLLREVDFPKIFYDIP